MQGESGTRIIRRIVLHPTSDIAILCTDPVPSDDGLSIQVYQDIDDELIDGGDFIGFGYPMEGSDYALPVGRLFKGHFQRTFGYDPPSGGSRYLAGEMNIPAPAGSSGGPIAWSHRPDRLVATVTTNHDSYALLDRLEEVEKNGVVYREQISRVVSYGIAAMLVGMKEWINEQSASQ
jgi:hypothetical protein